MISFLASNWVTAVIVIALAFCVLLAVRKIIKDKKSGKGSCGQDCSGCPYSASCDKK
ncbi:MAG: FeoB-associated Cys-rich membrane protein [Eubacterium sp.]|nr:FeoB-associated Cys-rich membrane protein [Eubacterium sp.]